MSLWTQADTPIENALLVLQPPSWQPMTHSPCCDLRPLHRVQSHCSNNNNNNNKHEDIYSAVIMSEPLHARVHTVACSGEVFKTQERLRLL